MCCCCCWICKMSPIRQCDVVKRVQSQVRSVPSSENQSQYNLSVERACTHRAKENVRCYFLFHWFF